MLSRHKKARSVAEQLLAFWQAQLRESSKKPWLAGLLLRQGVEIGRRFTRHHGQLRALPGKWRRALWRKLSLGLAGAALLLVLSGAASCACWTASATQAPLSTWRP